MGQSADATIAWGVQLYDKEGEIDYDDDAAVAAHEALGEKLEEFEDEDLARALGFAEEFPGWPEHLRGLPLAQRDTDEYRAHQAKIDAYRARYDAAVPLETDSFGTYDYGGTALVFRRTRANVDWSIMSVDPATLAPPTEEERAKLNAVLDHLGFTGDREPKLLLFAMYG